MVKRTQHKQWSTKHYTESQNKKERKTREMKSSVPEGRTVSSFLVAPVVLHLFKIW